MKIIIRTIELFKHNGGRLVDHDNDSSTIVDDDVESIDHAVRRR